MRVPAKAVAQALLARAQTRHPQRAPMARGPWTTPSHAQPVCPGTGVRAQILASKYPASWAPTQLARNTVAHLAPLAIPVQRGRILVRRAELAPTPSVLSHDPV